MERIANCSCGFAQITLKDEPKIVAACSCNECKKRTGTAFGIGVYFSLEQVTTKLPSLKTYQQNTESKKSVIRHFCEYCGTTLFWEAEAFPRMLGVAAGCFEKSQMPEPKIAVWNCSKLDWVKFPENWKQLEKQG